MPLPAGLRSSPARWRRCRWRNSPRCRPAAARDGAGFPRASRSSSSAGERIGAATIQSSPSSSRSGHILAEGHPLVHPHLPNFVWFNRSVDGLMQDRPAPPARPVPPTKDCAALDRIDGLHQVPLPAALLAPRPEAFCWEAPHSQCLTGKTVPQRGAIVVMSARLDPRFGLYLGEKLGKVCNRRPPLELMNRALKRVCVG